MDGESYYHVIHAFSFHIFLFLNVMSCLPVGSGVNKLRKGLGSNLLFLSPTVVSSSLMVILSRFSLRVFHSLLVLHSLISLRLRLRSFVSEWRRHEGTTRQRRMTWEMRRDNMNPRPIPAVMWLLPEDSPNQGSQGTCKTLDFIDFL